MMFRFCLKRLIATILTLLLIATATFFIMRSIPGGPFTSERALPESVEREIAKRYNWDAPLYEQYFDYMKDVVKLDFGISFRKSGMSVNTLIAQGFPNSAKIGGIAILLVIIVGIPLGIASALKKNS